MTGRLPQWLAAGSIAVNCALFALALRLIEARAGSLEQTIKDNNAAIEKRVEKLEQRADTRSDVDALARHMDDLREMVQTNMRNIAAVQAKQEERAPRFEKIESRLSGFDGAVQSIWSAIEDLRRRIQR